MKKILAALMMAVVLSGCSWKNYEGCALWPTDTEPVYEYSGEKYYSPMVNVSQTWWEYKRGEYGFWYIGQERGNTPWWAYPKDIVSVPIMYGTLFVMVLCGAEMP
jgi:uncharacterized protein YceK